MARTLVKTIGLLACLLSAAGCMKQVYNPNMRIPLQMEGFPPNERSVAVSMIYTTGWIHVFAILHPDDVKVDNVETHRIEFIDKDHPTLFVPESASSIFYGSILTFLKSDHLGLAVFTPGLAPMFYGNTRHMSAGLHLTLSQDQRYPVSPVSALAKPYVSPVQAPPPYESSTAPATDPASLAAWHHLLDLTDFWDQLRWKWTWGESRAEIGVICRTIVQAVDAYESDHPEHRWLARQQRNIDLCRELLKQR